MRKLRGTRGSSEGAFLYSAVAATCEGVDRPEGPATGPEQRNRRLVSPMRELERELPNDAARAAEAPPISALAVIGPGRVGHSVAAAADRAGIATRLAGRDDAVEACRESEAALLCVPDAEIASASGVVATAVPSV